VSSLQITLKKAESTVNVDISSPWPAPPLPPLAKTQTRDISVDMDSHRVKSSLTRRSLKATFDREQSPLLTIQGLISPQRGIFPPSPKVHSYQGRRGRSLLIRHSRAMQADLDQRSAVTSKVPSIASSRLQARFDLIKFS
jgi:hypothetical protein